jgi:nucleoside-diphosphate-sugar epimerase
VNCRQADVRDPDALRRHLPGADVVIHAAAALPLWKRSEIFAVNTQGTRNVLLTAREVGVPRVVYISSTAVYGVPEKHPLEETDPVQGVGPYGESKIQAEGLCAIARESGLCVPVIRPKTFIGTGRLGVFQILYDWVAGGKRIPIIGNGRNRYQLLEVTDLVDAIWRLASAPANKANATFNVGAARFATVREDVGELCRYAATGARVLPTPAPLVTTALQALETAHLSPLYKWVYGTAAKDSFVSTEKIERAVGWQPVYSNAEALIRSYQWYLEHAAEISAATGVTHRVAWSQGALGLVKRLL